MTVTGDRSRRTRVNPVEFEEAEDERPAQRSRREDGPQPSSRTAPKSRSRRNVRDDEAPWDDDGSMGGGLKEFTDEASAQPDDGETDTLVVPIFRGNKAIKENRAGQDGSLYFKWGDDGDFRVVKFLEEEPWSFHQHWVQRQGKMSFPCAGKKCPLCEVGVKKAQKVVYSILNLSLDEGPVVQTLEVSSTLADTLRAYDEDRKTGPLSRMYWSLSRTKAERSTNTFARYNYSFLPIKERDLEEDYGISLAAAEEALDIAEAPDPEKVLGQVTMRMLQDIADEIMG